MGQRRRLRASRGSQIWLCGRPARAGGPLRVAPLAAVHALQVRQRRLHIAAQAHNLPLQHRTCLCNL